MYQAPAVMPSAYAQAQKSEVVICSTYDQAISVMIIHLHPYETNRKLVRGWYTVDAGKCQTLGPVPKGQIFLYAEAADRKTEWKGTGAFACLARRATERTLYDGQPCVEGEENKGFFPRSADNDKTTVNLN